jgi:Na+/H+-dicarboxylate symporter
MKHFTRISMSSLLLTVVLTLPINAQQPSPQGPSEPAGRQDTTTTPNVQQPTDSNSTTPINSNVPETPVPAAAPNWILAIISLAIGLGIGYVMGRRGPGMRRSTRGGMPSPGRV